MNRPTQYPSEAFAELQQVVGVGHYRRFDDPGHLPSALSRVGGFPPVDHYRTSLVMSSGTSEHPPTIGGITPAPGTPIFRVSAIRFDVHRDGQPHFNRDDVLIF